MHCYILMNKSFTRMQIMFPHDLFVYSGELTSKYICKVTPRLYRYKIHAMWKAFAHNSNVVKIEITADVSNIPLNREIWVLDRDTFVMSKITLTEESPHVPPHHYLVKM